MRRGLLIAMLLPALAAEAQEARFGATAVVRVYQRSEDGRYALHARAERTRSAPPAGGARFELKVVRATAANCEALPDALFVNGFEG